MAAFVLSKSIREDTPYDIFHLVKEVTRLLYWFLCTVWILWQVCGFLKVLLVQ